MRAKRGIDTALAFAREGRRDATGVGGRRVARGTRAKATVGKSEGVEERQDGGRDERARAVVKKALVFVARRQSEGRTMAAGLAKQSTGPLFALAAVTMVDRKMIALITQSVASFIKLYLLLLFVRVLLTWFPNVNWMRQPWTMLRQVTDPYLNLFRNLIPPIMVRRCAERQLSFR